MWKRRKIYLRYSGFFDLWQALEVNLQPQDTISNFLSEQLRLCSDFQASENDSMLACALGRCIELMSYSMLHDNPDLIEKKYFRDMLIRIGYAVFSK